MRQRYLKTLARERLRHVHDVSTEVAEPAPKPTPKPGPKVYDARDVKVFFEGREIDLRGDVVVARYEPEPPRVYEASVTMSVPAGTFQDFK